MIISEIKVVVVIKMIRAEMVGIIFRAAEAIAKAVVAVAILEILVIIMTTFLGNRKLIIFCFFFLQEVMISAMIAVAVAEEVEMLLGKNFYFV